MKRMPSRGTSGNSPMRTACSISIVSQTRAQDFAGSQIHGLHRDCSRSQVYGQPQTAVGDNAGLDTHDPGLVIHVDQSDGNLPIAVPHSVAQGAERWVCLVAIAIIVFSLYIFGIAWTPLPG